MVAYDDDIQIKLDRSTRLIWKVLGCSLGLNTSRRCLHSRSQYLDTFRKELIESSTLPRSTSHKRRLRSGCMMMVWDGVSKRVLRNNSYALIRTSNPISLASPRSKRSRSLATGSFQKSRSDCTIETVQHSDAFLIVISRNLRASFPKRYPLSWFPSELSARPQNCKRCRWIRR